MGHKSKVRLLTLILAISLCTAAPLVGNEDTERNEGSDDVNTKVEKKSKLAAFLLSFFLGGFGVDWFYLSKGTFTYIMVGILKLLFIKFQCCCCCLSIELEGLDNGLGIGMFICFKFLVAMAYFIWWVVDWVRVLTDSFPDGYGMELMTDM